MHKILFPLIALGLMMGLSSCQFEEDNLFDASAAERLNEAVEKYTAAIARDGGTYVMEYWPTDYSTQPSDPAGQGYLLCMQFKPDGSVRVGANNPFTLKSYRESTSLWEVITDLGGVLSFNSYNPYFHCFSDPSDYVMVDGIAVPTGDRGYGVGGDYEFIVTNIDEHTGITTLKGKKNGTYSRMIRLPEGTNFEEYLADVEAFRKSVFPDEMNNYVLMKVGNTVFKSEEWNSSDPNIYPFNGRSDLDDSRHPFIINKIGGKYHLTFRNDLTGDHEGEKVRELVYNEETHLFENPAEPKKYVIQGMRDSDMYEFFHAANEQKMTWNFDLEQASPELAEAFAKLIEGSYPTEKSKYPYILDTTKGITVQTTDYYSPERPFTFTVKFNFTQNGKPTSKPLSYTFTAHEQENTVNLEYVKPNDTNSTNYQSTIAGLQTVLDYLACNLQPMCAAFTGYYVNSVKLANAENPEHWFVLTK